MLGTAGHAHDGTTRRSRNDPRHVDGLLTHPSVPPLTAALVMAQRLGGIDGKRFMLAFQTGFEVECKISEWMKDRHYRRGHHSSGTVGTFGAAATAAKLLGLSGDRLAHALGIAASFAAGHPLQLRHHDQAAARGTRVGERRDGGPAGGARLHRGSRPRSTASGASGP